MKYLLLSIIVLCLATSGRSDSTLVVASPEVNTVVIDSVMGSVTDTTVSGDIVENQASSPHPAEHTLLPGDSVKIKDTVLVTPVRDAGIRLWEQDSIDYEKHLSQNPTVALVRSMLVPGLGQVGNESYLKAGIVAVLETWLISKALDYRNQARDKWGQYSRSTDIDLRNDYYAEYQSARDQRNKYTWFVGITVFLSMFDAYVDAHMSGTPDDPYEDRLDIDIAPDGNGGANLSFSLSF